VSGNYIGTAQQYARSASFGRSISQLKEAITTLCVQRRVEKVEGDLRESACMSSKSVEKLEGCTTYAVRLMGYDSRLTRGFGACLVSCDTALVT
jgi:hypothetical protein